MLAVAFALLPTAGLGESFAQAGGQKAAIREKHVVKADGRYVVLDVDLNYSDDYSPNLQHSLSQMMFGAGNDSFAASYKQYLGRYGTLLGMENKSKANGVEFRCYLEVLDYKPGRYAVFHSFSDSTMEEKRADKMLIATYGYEAVPVTGSSQTMRMFLKTTNERYMLYDLSKDRPLTPADVFPTECIKELGVDTLRGYVSIGVHDGELKFGNQQFFASYALDDWNANFTEYFKQLIGLSDGKPVVEAGMLADVAGNATDTAQVIWRAKTIQNYHMVNENGWNVLYQVDLLYPDYSTPELQRCLSRMVFGIESDSVQGAYCEWLRQKKQLENFAQAVSAQDFMYRKLLRMVDHEAGRYAVFSSTSDSSYMEYASETMPQKQYGYLYDCVSYRLPGRSDKGTYYKVKRVKTNERAFIFDFQRNKPLEASDVFTPEGIKKLGIDTLGADVNIMVYGNNLFWGNPICCFAAGSASVKDNLTDYFIELTGFGSNKPRAIDEGTYGNDKVYEDGCDRKPEFPGGDNSMREWVADNLEYPTKAEEEAYQGSVIVNFIVERDGSLSSLRVAKSVHPLLDIAALRLVASMPKWRPGMKDGKLVRAKHTLPVTFRLQ